MPGYNSQRRVTVRTLPKLILFLFCVLFVCQCVLFVCQCVLFVCQCVLYYCHWVSTQLQLSNISLYISLQFISLMMAQLQSKHVVESSELNSKV